MQSTSGLAFDNMSPEEWQQLEIDLAEFEYMKLLEAELADKCEEKLTTFIKEAWPILEPNNQYIHNWHIDCVAEYLEAVTAGQLKRLIINEPPRYMKSTMVSVAWPVWEWIKTPETRWIFTSYAASLSTKHSMDRRALIQSYWFQERWGKRFKLVSEAKTEPINDKRGIMLSTSVGGSATGKGGNRLIIDDPHNPMEAISDVQRQQAINFFDNTLMTRLDDKKAGAIVLVMQRLHENDLTGHLLNQGIYEHLCLPVEAPFSVIVTTPKGTCFQRERGDLLWPDREGPEEIKGMKIALGGYNFAGQYQQDPRPQEGGLINRSWWKYYKQLPKLEEIIMSWDCAFKDLKTSDYVVGQVWGRNKADKYLIDQVRGKMDFPSTIVAIRALWAKYPQAKLKLIEDKANGTAVIATLKRSIPGIIPVNPDKSKVARVNGISPDVEAGNVYLPDPSIAPWIGDFVEEFAAFPNGANDDQVDATTQALDRLGSRRYHKPVGKPTGW